MDSKTLAEKHSIVSKKKRLDNAATEAVVFEETQDITINGHTYTIKDYTIQNIKNLLSDLKAEKDPEKILNPLLMRSLLKSLRTKVTKNLIYCIKFLIDLSKLNRNDMVPFVKSNFDSDYVNNYVGFFIQSMAPSKIKTSLQNPVVLDILLGLLGINIRLPGTRRKIKVEIIEFVKTKYKEFMGEDDMDADDMDADDMDADDMDADDINKDDYRKEILKYFNNIKKTQQPQTQQQSPQQQQQSPQQQQTEPQQQQPNGPETPNDTGAPATTGAPNGPETPTTQPPKSDLKNIILRF